ncbi:MAG: hypothetical protein DDT34_02336 [Firmicutes bacterium]|nr:hypothetical protein [Bacillota bacterium]
MAVALLLVIPMAAIPAAGGEERGIGVGDFNWDARYWWESVPSEEREGVKEIMAHIFSRLFPEVDALGMSTKEFEQFLEAAGPEMRDKVGRMLVRYAEERGLLDEEKVRLLERWAREDAGERPDQAWDDVRYWWELLDPKDRKAQRDLTIYTLREHFPGVDLMSLTPAEFERLLRPPLEFVCLDEMREHPGVLGVFGTIPSFETEHEKRGWIDALERLAGLTAFAPRPDAPPGAPAYYPDGVIIGHGVAAGGYYSVTLYRNAPIDERVIYEIYSVISWKSERVGIEDVPVVFSTGGLFTPAIPTPADARLDARTQGMIPQSGWEPAPNFGGTYRPIIGGIMMTSLMPGGSHTTIGTIGFIFRHPWSWVWWVMGYVTSGHDYRHTRLPLNTQVWQPRMAAGNEVERITRVAAMHGFADAAGVDFGPVAPYIHRSSGITAPVSAWRDPVVEEWVSKSGARTGLTSGRVLKTRYDIVPWAPFGTLRDQVLTNLRFDLGDSGAPVYRLEGDRWIILGILAGGHDHATLGRVMVFSPVSGIRTELDVVPRTK